LPKPLGIAKLNFYIFSLVFSGLSVLIPFIFHQFNLGGAQFLPMHFFVLTAGFLFGWKTGLLVGIFSPLISFGFTHMPAFDILPSVVVELAIYGLVMGVLREKKVAVIPALILAMIAGRVGRLIFAIPTGSVSITLGCFAESWPGIVLQIILVPFLIIYIGKFFSGIKNEDQI